MAQPGFFDLDNRYESLSQIGDPLEILERSIPWETFRPVLNKALRKFRKSNAGRKPYDYVFMFKIVVLQSLYNLSDDQTEFQIKDRLSFMRFLDLDNTGKQVFADSAYRSEAIDKTLKQRGLKNQIKYKGYRDAPLSEAKRKRSSIRARAKIGLMNLAYNMQRYVYLTKSKPAHSSA